MKKFLGHLKKYTVVHFFFLSMLSGCSIIPDHNDKLDRFLLDSIPQGHIKPNKKKPALIIETPTLYAPLDNTRIAIKPTPTTIDYIANVEWADRLGTLIHESMIQSAQNSGFFDAVGKVNTGLQSRHMLLIDVRQFHKLCCSNRVEIEYFAQLLDTQDRNIIAAHSFVITQKCNEESANSIALALNKCHRELSFAIVSWLKDKM